MAQDPCPLSWYVKLVRSAVRLHAQLHRDMQVFWMPLPSLLLASRPVRSSRIFGLGICPWHLRMIAQCSLTSPASVLSLLASVMSSVKNGMLSQGTNGPLSEGQSCASITKGIYLYICMHWVCVTALLALLSPASERRKPAPLVSHSAWCSLFGN